MLSFFLSLSFLWQFLPLSLYCNGGGALAGCDCLIDRYLEAHMEEETGAEDEEVCVLSSTGTRSSVCLWRMMDYMGATGVCVCV